MASILDTIRSWMTGADDGADDYEIDGYVLERRTPDPNPRVRTYDDPLSPDEVTRKEDLPDGEYILQELKPTGSVGEAVWREELAFSG